jgi:predicted MFS family arabinose efflux permease
VATNSHGPGISKGFRAYALGVLFLVYALNFVDRQIVIILAESIKRDLHIADWQIGIMSGFAFAILYTFLGLPIARLAERASRPKIIAAAIATWSVFTMLCGSAQSFLYMVAARVGVGIGEAGCTPPAISLIADYYPKETRAGAISVYVSGASFGALLGIGVGGLIADHWGWRIAFFIVGAPGVVLALITAFTLMEPRDGSRNAVGGQTDVGISFWDALRYLSNKKSYVLLVAAQCSKAFLLYGLSAFYGSLFLRMHTAELAAIGAQYGMRPAGVLGIVLGLSFGGGSALGSIVGGVIADRFAKRDLRALAVIPAISALLTAPLQVWSFSSSSVVVALFTLGFVSVTDGLGFGPPYAAIQGLVPQRMRATSTAISLFGQNLIGLGLGSLAVGLSSDLLARKLDMGSGPALQRSMELFACLGCVPAYLFWKCAKRLREETES